MQLVIISGHAATGKTTVGKELAHALDYPYRSKDAIKEALFDSEARNSWDFSWYEKRAKKIFFDEIKECIVTGHSAVIESNFTAGDKKRLLFDLKPEITIAEIYCYTRGFTSFRRFFQRNEQGKKHKGHHDRRWYGLMLFQNLIQYLHIWWPYKPLGLTKRILLVDTTDFSKVDYKKTVDFVRQN